MLLNIPYYNISENKEYQYSYLLHILIRITRLVEKQKITRIDFIEVCKNWGISKRNAFRIWSEWAYKNKFIKYVSDNRDYLYITWKDKFDLFIEKVPFHIYKKITWINSLKDFLHYAFLGKNWIESEGITTSKWIRKIANETHTTMQTVCNRNKRCETNFWLEKQNRYWVYNWYFVRLTNKYLSWVRIIKNKYCAVKKQVKKYVKITSEKLAPLFNTINSKIDKKLEYLPAYYYETINNVIYPKLT